MYNADIILIRQMILIIGRIFEYTERITDPDDFAADYKTVDATLMNFVALGETANKLSDRFREKHNNIEWRKIYDFRNIIAHDYFGIDEEEVLGITKKHLPILKKDLTDLLDSYIL